MGMERNVSGPWRTVHDCCFYGQIMVAIAINAVQSWHMLGSVEGVLLTYFVLMESFMLFNFLLSLNVYRAKPTPESRMAMKLYATFMAMIAVSMLSIAVNGTYRWAVQDTWTTASFCAGATMLALLAWRYGWKVRSAEVLTSLGILVKTVPQLFLAWRIMADGGAGIHVATLWLGHSSSLMRLTQMIIMNTATGWTRDGKGLLISETGNELSWIVVTIAWYARP